MKRIWTIFILTGIFFCSLAQDEIPESYEWASPGVEGDRRSKFLEAVYEKSTPFNMVSSSVLPGVADSTVPVHSNDRFKAGVKIPGWLRPRFKVIFGLKFAYEEFNFEGNAAEQRSFYHNLQNKHLKSLGGDFIVLRSVSNKNYLIIRGSMSLKGDYRDTDIKYTKFLKGSFTALWGWKKDKNTSYSTGFSYSYTFGKPSVYPVFIYDKTISEKWGLEAILPAKVFVRYSFDAETILLGGFEIEGGSYHIEVDDPPLDQFEFLELRKSAVRGRLIFEREIYDWIWFQLSSGLEYPFSFNLAKDNHSRFIPFTYEKNEIVRNRISPFGFISGGIFLVPPEKWTD